MAIAVKAFMGARNLQVDRVKRVYKTLIHSENSADFSVNTMMNGCGVYMIYCIAAKSFKKQVGRVEIKMEQFSIVNKR